MTSFFENFLTAYRKITTRLFGDLAIDYAARTLRVKEQSVELAKIEFDIVELLSLHPGQVFNRETIYERVRGLEGMSDNTVIKEHIRRIRNKLGEGCIETVWGCGSFIFLKSFFYPIYVFPLSWVI